MPNGFFHNTTAPSNFKVGTGQVTRMYHGSTLVWQYEHSLSCSPSSLSTSRANGSQNYAFAVTVTGGSGTFTYSWAWISGGGTGMGLSNTTTATVTVNASGNDVLREGTLRCTVTDTGNGSLVKTIDVPVSITFGTPV